MICLLLASFSFFPFSSQNPFFFPQSTKSVSEKRRSRNHHRWIVVKFEYPVCNPIPNILTVGNFKIISELRGKPIALYHFNFPKKPKNCLGKTTIPTRESAQSPPNLSQKNDDLGLIDHWIVVKFEHHVHNLIPSILTVGNFDIMYELREIPFEL
ncbi:hypothetical protein HKD37_16G045849 [Glycine soja]